MRTYSHGIIGWLIYWKGSKRQQWMAAIGAMVPDVILALGFPFHFLPHLVVFKFLHNLFHHSWLHLITELLHSFVLLVPLLVLSYFFFKRYLPFFVGMFSHGVVDLLTHQRWSYNHLYPFAFEPVRGIVSYTSTWFTVVEHLLVLVFIIWLTKKYASLGKNVS